MKGVEGSQQDYGMRVYDPRIGRFLSVDPITKQYPELTPYQFASNKPIQAIDLDGLEGWELSTPSTNLKRQAEHLFNPPKPKLTLPNQPPATIRPTPAYAFSEWGKRQSQLLRNQYEANQSIQNKLALDPVGASQGLQVAQTIAAPVQYGQKIGEGIKEGDGSKVFWSSVGFGLSLTTFGKTPLKSIPTPYGRAIQSELSSALKAVSEVEAGATLYRIGTLGKSETAAGQFWSLENPALYLNKPAQFAERFGIPTGNLKSGELFIEAGKLQKGTPFITRPAPAVGANKGGAIEVVTNPGGVKLETFNTLKL